MKQFEDKFMDIQAEMVSLCFEYVRGQAEKIYIYGIADSLYSFNVFYQIKGKIVHKHQVNEYFDANNKIDTNLEDQLLRLGVSDIEKMIALCKEYNREHPTEMWLVYDVKANSLDTNYSYEGRYEKDEELIPRLVFDKWFEEAKQEVEGSN